MPSIRTKFLVGLFVILGIAMVIVFILWLGLSQYFKEGRKYLAFFDESVQGLKKDSFVKYSGVDIGRVESISVAPDGNLIRIGLNLDEPLKDIDEMVAQIKSAGITGIMFIELERKKKDDKIAPTSFSFDTEYPVVATKPSDIKQLLADIYDIVEKINQIDIPEVADRLMNTVNNINQTVKDAQVKKISGEIQKILKKSQTVLNEKKWIQIRKNLHKTSKNINDLIENTSSTVSDINSSLKKHDKHLSESIQAFKTASENAASMLQNGNLLVNDTRSKITNIDRKLLQTLENLESATNHLSRLISQIMDQPSTMFFSSPSPPKTIEPVETGTEP